MVLLAFGSSTWETEAGGCKFEVNLVYTRLHNSETVSEKEGGRKEEYTVEAPIIANI